MKQVIETEKLKKHFGQTKAVDGVSFDVKKGEILGFLGPNGAGKTTVIRCLMDFIRPDSGEVKIFGENPTVNSSWLKSRIGYLASSPRIYEHWTGQEHIELIKKIRNVGQYPNKLINELDFDPKKKSGQLSTGNKQKLALILSLMANPELLIMDEPTLGLDPILQNKIYDILRGIKEKGKTILISSHNLHEVEKICDRVVIIKEGKIVAIEDVDQIKKRHLYLVKINLKKDLGEKIFSKIENITVEKKYDHYLELSVKGDINPLLEIISKENIKDIEISHADLEEIFLEYYK
jgi:ABC-2 type transport system ATP-binding protein